MNRLRRWIVAILIAPKRFLDWVYAPTGRVAPTRSQAIAHMRAGGLGQDTTRWMAIEEEERRRQVEAIRRVRSRTG